MGPSLRVARVDVGGYRLPTHELAGLDLLHRELQTLVRRHLPGVTASLFALPVPCDDGRMVDWYSDLAGQPVPLVALPAARRAAVKSKLEERLDAVRRLADALPARVKGSEAIAAALRAATRYPDDSHVYVIGDEPVLTLWGFVRVEPSGRRRKPGPELASAGAPESASGRRRGWRVGLVLMPIVLAGLGGGLWWWLERGEVRSLESELQSVLAAVCAQPDRLSALELRIDRLDPEARKHAELRERIAAEQGRCAAAESLDRALSAADWTCPRLAEIRQGLAGTASAAPSPDLGREPFRGLVARLDHRVAACERAARTAAELESRRDDCRALAELGAALDPSDSDEPPWLPVREGLDRALALCAETERLVVALDGALATDDGGCSTLATLDRAAAALDPSRAPVAALRERLDTELGRCARAGVYRRKLVDAQLDCSALRALDRELTAEDTQRTPLREIRGRLDRALARCGTLEKLEEAVTEGLKPP